MSIFIPYTESYSWLLIGLSVYGLIGKLALDPILISYMADITPSSMYSKVYGFSTSAACCHRSLRLTLPDILQINLEVWNSDFICQEHYC